MKTALLAAALLATATMPALASRSSAYHAIVACRPTFGEMNDGQKALFVVCMQSKGFQLVCRIDATLDLTRCWDATQDDD
jgi:hypothetical protein